ncbi:putative TonB-dependent receptor [Pseudomonas aeruginosa]|nr:putative TonB-dependent receptor [Pseudomonas aeruginosa]
MREDGLGGQSHQLGAYLAGPLVPGKLGLALNGESRRQQETPDADERRLSELEGGNADSGGLNLSWTPDDAQRIDLGHQRGRERRWRNSETGGPRSRYYESRDVIERERWSLAHNGQWDWGQQPAAHLPQPPGAAQRAFRRTTAEQPAAAYRQRGRRPPQHAGLRAASLHPRRRMAQGRTGGSLGEYAAGDASARHKALFLQDEIAFGPDWSLTLGSRFDKHEAFGWESSPRLYLLHHLSDALTLRAGVGRGYKAPSLKQLVAGVCGGGRRRALHHLRQSRPEAGNQHLLRTGRRLPGRRLDAEGHAVRERRHAT